MSLAPEAVHQVIPSIVERDAVSYHTLEVRRLLRSLGVDSEIFSDVPGPGLRDEVLPLSALPTRVGPDAWLLYQASIGSPSAEVFAAHPGVKILNYHNITPPGLVADWMPFLAEEVELGRRQLTDLAPICDLAVAVSQFNAGELEQLGYRRVAVAPLMMHPAMLDTEPDVKREQEVMAAKADGGSDWLFVGQMLPHKSQHDVVAAFAAYRRAYDRFARLHLVGPLTCQPYEQHVRELIDRLSLGEAVRVHGSLETADVVALYRSCDVFVGCSEHEGFCAPLIEAMHHGLPVVAYRRTAVPETLGNAGVLLETKEPAAVAAVVQRMLSDRALWRERSASGYARARDFSPLLAGWQLMSALRLLGADGFPPPEAMSSVESVRPRRPLRIDQVTPSIVARDAVSFHYLEAQRVLRSLGFVSEIYAATMGAEMAGRAHPLEELPKEGPDRQWICYQASIGTRAADVVAAHPGVKLVNYHNVTPAHLVEAWMPFLGMETRWGREQLERLAPLVELAIGVSAYNVRELEQWGYRRTAVATLMLDRHNFDSPPQPRRREALLRAREGGGADWLFVGSILPHKGQHDLIMGFAAYRRAYDQAARLHLVGREVSLGYGLALRRLVEAAGLRGSVLFEGSVSAAELSAFYACCDVFVGCSDHEGFGAPLIEAMHHGLPVIAYGAGAVPDTVGDDALVVYDKEPALLAAAVNSVLQDRELYGELKERGMRRAATFSGERARQEFRAGIESAVRELTE